MERDNRIGPYSILNSSTTCSFEESKQRTIKHLEVLINKRGISDKKRLELNAELARLRCL